MTAATRIARTNGKMLRRFGDVHQLAGVPVQGQFVRPGKTFTLSDGIEIAARVPMLLLADADVPIAPVGSQAVCEGLTYSVQEARPDGLGLTVFELEKVLA
jgi:hypothetical protein